MSRLYVLIPGAGGAAWYWHRVEPLLRAAGHDAVAVDLPGPDPEATLDDYVAVVVRAVEEAGPHDELVLVAQSLGGFTAVLACARLPVSQLILLNAMIPAPGETPGEWWEATGQPAAEAELAKREGRTPGEWDPEAIFLHDLPDDVRAVAPQHDPDEAETIFASVCAVEAWPPVATRVIVGRADRLFPAEFQRRVAKERLDLDVDETPGGHLAALSRPEELAALILQS